MFLFLTRVLLWLLVIVVLWYVLLQLLPRVYLTWLGGVILATFIVLAFLEPTDPTAATVWYVLSLPLRPLGLALVLLVLGVKGGLDEVKGSQVAAALLILLLGSTPFLPHRLTREIERDALDLAAEESTAGSTAIVLLGWNTTRRVALPEGESQIQLGDRGELLSEAVRLYNAGAAPRVIVSAGRRRDVEDAQGRRIVEANDLQTLLADRGVPSESTIVEGSGLDARSSAEGVRQILEERGLGDRVVLVASAIQMRRAALSFAELEFEVVPRPALFYARQLRGADGDVQVEDFIPSVEALSLTTQLTDEYLARIYYFLRGWLSPDRQL
jgi:uncharacterized SAM-binding protein YcdF (DUF218 family)